MKTKLLPLLVALIATTALWASNTITYTATEKLTRSTLNVGARTFGPAITNHTFSNGKGTITCSGEITTIGSYAFYECSGLKSVTIGNSVTTIGVWAFYKCSGLTSVSIPNSVTTIGDYAFYECSGLASVTIGNSVTTIGNMAFFDCSGLTKTNYTGTIAEWCKIKFGDFHANPMYNSHNFYINDVEVKDLVIPDGVDTIGERSFLDCRGLTSVTIPNSVTTIGNYAFYGCSGLTSVTIGNSVTTIGESAFNYCSGLTSVTIPNSVTTIGESAFSGCRGLTSVTIPNSVTTIGSYAFSTVNNIVYNGTATGSPWNAKCVNGFVDGYLVYSDATKTTLCGCSSVAKGEIAIPNSVITIGSSAFYECRGLTSVMIGNSVTTIGNFAFAWCDSLTFITIPNSVTTIGEYAFYRCYGLTSVTSYATTPPTCGSSCFYIVNETIPVYVPAQSVAAYKQAVGWKEFSNIQEAFMIITCIANNGTITGGEKKRNGDTCTLVVTPDYGYYFTQWSDGNTDNPRTIVLTQDSTFTAEFAKNIYTFDVQTADSVMGSVMGAGLYEYQTNVDITAIPNYGYHFDHWSDGSIDNPYTIFLTQDTILTAYFVKNIYSVSSVSQNGTIYGQGSYKYLDTCTMVVTPDYGYYFTQWSDGNTDNPRTIVVTQDSTFTAEFAKNIYTFDVQTADSIMGSVMGTGQYEYQTNVDITAAPNYGYHFTKWSDGNTDNPRTVSVTGDKTYTAQFDKNQYVVTISKDEHIQSVIGAGTYEYLDKVTLSVTVETYYRFDHWSDGNTDNPRALIVTQDTSFTAISAKITEGLCGDDLTWNYSDGVLVISGTGTMYDYTQGTAPWMPLFRDSISSLVINNGCTSIGNFAFYGLPNKNLKTVDLPNGIEQIGQYAFANCEYLKNLYLGLSLEKIAANAFANDERLLYITCYAIEPPLLDESAFANYDIYLKVPCEVVDEYKVAKGWKLFNKENVSCIGAEEKSVTTDEVTVAPEANQATFTWPAEDQAAGYSIEITKDSVVFCTLKFNAIGQLTGIAFAPGRGHTAMAHTANPTNAGWQFTVTGLNQASKYAYTLDALNASQQSIKHYHGEFATDGYTDLLPLPYDGNSKFLIQNSKLIKNGRLLIERNGTLFDARGARVK